MIISWIHLLVLYKFKNEEYSIESIISNNLPTESKGSYFSNLLYEKTGEEGDKNSWAAENWVEVAKVRVYVWHWINVVGYCGASFR